MLQLVTLTQLMQSRACAKIAIFKKSIATTLVMLSGIFFADLVNAQVDITMPTVDIDGIDDDSDGAEIVAIILKYIARIAIWIAMLLAGLVALKTILKSWNEQKSNDQGKWGAVVGDSLGSVIMVILVIAVGTWILSFLS
jgi:hypothetical protein